MTNSHKEKTTVTLLDTSQSGEENHPRGEFCIQPIGAIEADADMLAHCQCLFEQHRSLECVLRYLREQHYPPLKSVAIVQELQGVDFWEAQKRCLGSETWTDIRQLNDEISDALADGAERHTWKGTGVDVVATCQEVSQKTLATDHQHLRDILQLNKKVVIRGAYLTLKPYVYEETVEYMYTVFACLDAGRLMQYGIGELVQHVEGLKLSIQPLLNALKEEALYEAVKQVVQRMNVFLDEYRFDVARHPIGHIGFDNDVFLVEGNAYQCSQRTSMHIYCQFTRYILQGIQAYCSVKKACLDLWKCLEQEQRGTWDSEEITREITLFSSLAQAIENAVHLVEHVEADASGSTKRRELFLQRVTQADTLTQRVLAGVVRAMSLEGQEA